jgi:serine/threonine protein kinase
VQRRKFWGLWTILSSLLKCKYSDSPGTEILLDCLDIAARKPITSWCMSIYAIIPWSGTYLVCYSVDMHIQYLLWRCYRLISLLLLLGETDRSANSLEWNKRHAIAIGIAKCLRFLHEECRGGPIIHVDLQPSNVLLTHDLVPMVSWRIPHLSTYPCCRTCKDAKAFRILMV